MFNNCIDWFYFQLKGNYYLVGLLQECKYVGKLVKTLKNLFWWFWWIWWLLYRKQCRLKHK